MKVGIIGFGSIGNRHYKNLLFYTKDIVVLSQRSDVPTPAVAVKNLNDFAKLGPYDVIFVTNETHKHFDTITACLKLNPRAFFIEKPLSHNIEGLVRLAGQLKKRKISTWVGYCLHFYAPLMRVKEILNSGRLGKIFYMRVSAGQDLAEWRKRDYRLSYSANRNKGGGVMLDLVHDINYPAWLLGEKLTPKASYIDRISNLDIQSEDFADCVFKSDSGIIVSVHEDYIRRPGCRALEVAGEKGTLLWNSVSNLITLETGTSRTFKKVAVEHNDMYEKELKHFFRLFSSGKYFSNFNEAIKDIKNIERLKFFKLK